MGSHNLWEYQDLSFSEKLYSRISSILIPEKERNVIKSILEQKEENRRKLEEKRRRKPFWQKKSKIIFHQKSAIFQENSPIWHFSPHFSFCCLWSSRSRKLYFSNIFTIKYSIAKREESRRFTNSSKTRLAFLSLW